MAEKKKDETIEEPAVEAEVTEPAAEVEATPEPEVVEPEAAAEPEAETQEPGSENQVPEVAVEPEAAVAEPEAAPEPAAPAKKQRSGRHVPRSARRTRTKVVREQPKQRKPITRTEKPEGERGRRQERRGVVVSDKGDKTIIVKVDVIKSHPRYKKVIRSTVKFHAHDEENTAGVGDKVRIIEARPLSKLKRWRLAEIVEKAK
jgi:small subunit ribosomal protein S17